MICRKPAVWKRRRKFQRNEHEPQQLLLRRKRRAREPRIVSHGLFRRRRRRRLQRLRPHAPDGDDEPQRRRQLVGRIDRQRAAVRHFRRDAAVRRSIERQIRTGPRRGTVISYQLRRVVQLLSLYHSPGVRRLRPGHRRPLRHAGCRRFVARGLFGVLHLSRSSRPFVFHAIRQSLLSSGLRQVNHTPLFLLRIISCYTYNCRVYGAKCGRCGERLYPHELVMRAGSSLAFHLPCFGCFICGRPLQKGDQFVVRAGQLLCRDDLEKDLFLIQSTTNNNNNGKLPFAKSIDFN